MLVQCVTYVQSGNAEYDAPLRRAANDELMMYANKGYVLHEVLQTQSGGMAYITLVMENDDDGEGAS